MSIAITQTCDGCAQSRNLAIGPFGDHDDLTKAAETNGWVAVKPNKHLCKDCVEKALKK